jgi:hypothetical protein
VATQTKTPTADSVEAVAERLTELNEQAVANGRKAGAAYATSYEKAVVALVDSYKKAAAATRLDWVSTMATAQADFTREVTKAYISAARDLVA